MKFLLSLVLILSASAYAAPLDVVKFTTQTVVTATTTSTSGLAANPNRRYLLLQNNGSVTVYVKFGSAHSGSEGVWLYAGGNYEPIRVSTASVYFKSASSTAAVTVVEGM